MNLAHFTTGLRCSGHRSVFLDLSDCRIVLGRLTVILLGLLLLTQARGEENDLKEKLREAGRHLDKVEKQLGEWGHASISGFVLVPHQDGQPGPFHLDHSDATSNYVARIRANVQGRAAFLDKQTIEAELKAKFENKLPGAQPAALSISDAARQDELAGMEHKIRLAQLEQQLEAMERATNATYTSLFALNAPTATGGNTTNILNVTNIVNHITLTNAAPPRAGTVDAAGFGALLKDTASGAQLSETTILKLADTAKITERTLNFMSHPIGLPGNKQAFFAIGQISVFPGWRTKQDYVCEVSARFTPASSKNDFVEVVKRVKGDSVLAKPSLKSIPPVVYADSPVANSAGLGEPSVSLVSAFPFVEAQVFDQQTSVQRQFSLLLDLAATYLQAGYQVDAKLLLKFARQIQKDFNTRNAFPLVVPGVDAGTLTYRFDPEVSAMLDPTQQKPKAGAQLLPTTIPVMVLVIVDKDELENWRQLATDIETRWIPRGRRNGWAEVFWDAPIHWRTRDKRMSHERALETATSFDKAVDVLSCPGVFDLEAGYELRRRVKVLQYLAFGRSVFSDLPKPGPMITGLSPSTITQGEGGGFVVFGQHLTCRSTEEPVVTIGGVPLRMTESLPQRLTGSFGTTGGQAPSHLEPGQYDLVVETDHGSRTLAKALTVKKPEAPKPVGEFKDAHQITQQRPDITISQVLPSQGFFNGPTLITLKGSNFKPKGFNDPVSSVTVGGLPAQKLTVISDAVLTFEVPAWTKNNTTNGFYYALSKAPLVASSSFSARENEGLVFNLPAPPNPPKPPEPLATFPKDIEDQVKALQAVQKAFGHTNLTLLGGLQLKVLKTDGSTDSSTNTPASGGNGSPTIITVDNGPKNTTAK